MYLTERIIHNPPAPPPATPVDAETAQQQFTDFVDDKSFPCVGAKSALARDRIRFAKFGALGDPAASASLCARLREFSDEFPDPGSVPVSFIAIFDDTSLDEANFEARLWKQLQSMHEHDLASGFQWNADVTSDPAREDFSFSVGGRAYFVVGLHPHASRWARRSPAPSLVFNFHDQFESLKASGKFESMQSAIRTRDIALQGSVNPVLARFGKASEARQYSGRAVDEAWKCPFHAKETAGV